MTASPIPRHQDPDEWRERANCLGLNPELFLPHRGDTRTINEAKGVCAGCEVDSECLEWAMEHREVGIWGGLSERERRTLRRARWRAKRGLPA